MNYNENRYSMTTTEYVAVILNLFLYKKVHLRNKFHFSDVHRSMNAMGLVQSKWSPKGIMFNFDECQKNEIHLLYLHFVFTSFLFIISEVLE